MTLLYWWTHWFWITVHLYLVVAEPPEHSTSTIPAHQTAAASAGANATTAAPVSPAPAARAGANLTEEAWNATLEAALNATALNESLGANETSFDQSLLLGEPQAEGGQLSAAGITGITLGCVLVVGAICGVSYALYRNRGFNRPQVLNDRCSNPDSSGYLDDASVRDNSEEMYSLDNDSFLNSLEAMTIQNYWTDTVKHTKL